ncbi:PAS domain S-box protein [Flavihumibacter sp. R14]|nr:PAS domain S-box protein [Flavihumibacter soli]
MDEVYKLIADLSPEAQLAVDLKSRQLLYVNRAFRHLTGIDSEVISLDDVMNLVHAEDLEFLKNSFRNILQEDNPSADIRLETANQQKWIRLKAVMTSLKSEQVILAYANDITAERNNMNTIKKYTNKKNSTLNILSHDLRGPLSMANTATKLVKQGIKEPKLIELTQTVSSILSSSIDMINDLVGREFSETTDVELVKQRINIVSKLQDYMEEAQRSESITKRTFKFSCSDKSIYVNLDEAKFMQVINNLMTNALKFTHDDGIISLHISDQRNSVLFTFSDNGIGIPKPYHPTLFAKFTDARRKGLHGEDTIGLGLSIVKTIVEWHNGKIRFESKEGEGTTFYIEVPTG